ncbi:MAG: hypothetical protein ABI895_12515 [Deltaproteobacteria bacterium]
MVAGVARPRAGLERARIAAGTVALGLWAFASVEGWSVVAHLAALHGALGRGTLPALAASWVLLSALPCALGVWAAWPALGRLSFRQPANWGSTLALGLLFLASALSSYGAARVTPSALASVPELELQSALQSLGDLGPGLPSADNAPVLDSAPSACTVSPSAAAVSLIASFPSNGRATPAGASSPGTASVCLQGASVAAVIAELRAVLLDRARRGTLWLDWVSGVQPLSGRHSWIDSLKLRPGLDGVCAGPRCAVPGQLLVQGLFSTYRPVPFIPDFQFGVDPARVRSLLGAGLAFGLGDLLRIETRSYALRLDEQGARVTPLLRLRRREVPVNRAEVARATALAQSHVLSALLPDGKFRYTLDPMTGAADTQSFNLARQAGALLALCELGADTPEVRLGIERSLSVFAAFERRAGDLVLLTGDAQAPVARLGESALPLVSLLSCSRRLGAPLLPEAGGLTRALLLLQRPDGGFSPELDLETGLVRPGPEPLYAAGQALLALVLLEARQRDHFDPALPDLERVTSAVERAMSYVATRYWSHPLEGFFFLEENWHCLAARAALSVHPHTGYEDFCLRYVRFKGRLILEREQGADPDFDGGFGFGNLVPPHNTGAAGFGEALAAALAVERARGHAAPEQRRLLQKVLGFLLRQQWSPENCFLCASPEVIGGMSEHTHSLLTRIDFAQHAWAALGHGGEVLGWDLSEP